MWVPRVSYNGRRKGVAEGRRVGWECRRVDRTRTLYIKKGLHGMETSRFEPAGMYEAMDGEVKPDRRIEQRRAPKIFGKKGRRNEGSDRRKK